MKTNGIILGTLIAVASACSHNAGHVKPLKAAAAKDALTLKIEAEGRACLRKIQECEQDFFNRNPYASKAEAATECEPVKTACLEDAHSRLMAVQN